MKAEAPRARPASRTRRLRLVLIAGVALALAPGTFLRTSIGTRADPAVVTITPRAEKAGVSGELSLTGVWELSSPHGWFGGFSALAPGRGQALVAGTDRGFLLDIDLAGPAPRAQPGSYRFVGLTNRGREESVDLESLARDPPPARSGRGSRETTRWSVSPPERRAANIFPRLWRSGATTAGPKP